MSGKIKRLNTDLINKIAAGEIIERPASVVKELIENSIDAESTQIKIFIEHGGMKSICILDNGIGMSRDDAIMSFEQHATSKITSEEDLNNIHTLGFRGEALASIASVSKIYMETKEESEMQGTKLEIDGGSLKNVADTGCHTGTKITVSHLFYNIPARKKFLKSVNTEFGHITNIVIQYMLAFPEINFVLAHNNHILYNFPKTSHIEERIFEIYGDDLKNNLLSINYKADNIGLEISGFISNPTYSKPNKNYQLIFVNGRAVKNKTINHAIYKGYNTFLMIDRHPLAILYLTLPYHLIDVNIHPTKREVKFMEDRIIHEYVSQAVLNALKNNDTKKIEKENIKYDSLKEPLESYHISNTNQFSENQNSNTEFSLFRNETEKNENSGYETLLKPLAQIKKNYWILENEADTYIMDQHAFHERILYEKIKLSIKKSHFDIQRLLFPINIEFSIEETYFLKNKLKELNSLGIEIEYFGGTTFIIKEIPVFLIKANLKDFLINIYKEFDPDKNKFDFIDKTAIIMACHSAIKAGDIVKIEEIKGLIDEAEKLNIPYFCPHGRPALVKITSEELEKKFKR